MPQRRKSRRLHLLEGTLNSTRHADRGDAPQPTGRPTKPQFLAGRAEELWDQFFESGYWLTEVDGPALAAWCHLTVETERSFQDMPASRIAQWRLLGAELGLLPASRDRLAVGNAAPWAKARTDPEAAKYFDE
jgi:hypothetical protein